MSSRHDAQIRNRARRHLGALIDGKYRLLELLGYGSAGAVYRAENEWAGRGCALKLFHYEGPDEDALLRRFMREARASNRVQRDGRPHPNVADALDVGRDEESGRLFIVQELLQGVTLAQRLAEAPGHRIELDEAMGVILPILDAVGAAHAAGIVHRDLKPENIFLAELGGEVVPKVLDFGIAKLLDDRMTPNAEVMGTPQYMAPESFRGVGDVDGRADLWALGVILCEALSGSSPFASPTGHPVDSLRRIMSHEPQSLAADGVCSPQLWAVIRRAITKDPAARTLTAREMHDALVDALEPVRVLRVPAGVAPEAIREALYRGDDEVLRGAVRASIAPGDEPVDDDDAPEISLGEDPRRTFWNVHFHGPRFTVDSVLEVLKLRELKCRVELHFFGVPLGDEGLRRLVDAGVFSGVASISLRGAEITAEGLEALLASPHFDDVLRIDLDGNRLGAAGVAAFGAATRVGALRAIGLARAGIASGSMEPLLRAPLLARLRRLDLTQNELGDDDVLQILGLPTLPEALWLGLAGNRISPQFGAWAQRELGARLRALVL